MFKTGTYAPLIKGVSQQTPQQREDGQLSTQLNMLSDIVTGLRRRTGFRLQQLIPEVSSDSFFNITQLNGEYYLQSVTKGGTLRIHNITTGQLLHTLDSDYLVHTNKASIRTTVSRNQAFIMNTEKKPYKVLETTTPTPIDPVDRTKYGWYYLVNKTSKASVSVTVNVDGVNYYAIQDNTSLSATLSALYDQFNLNTAFTTVATVERAGNTLAFRGKSGQSITVTATGSSDVVHYWSASNAPVSSLAKLPSNLPSSFIGYTYYVGSTLYRYDTNLQFWTTRMTSITEISPNDGGWLRVTSGAFSKQYDVTISRQGSPTFTYSVTTHASTAAQATAEYVATTLYNAMLADTGFTAIYDAVREGTVIAISAKESGEGLAVWSGVGDTYMTTSDMSNVALKGTLPPVLPSVLDGYVMSVGTGSNLAYYKYDKTTQRWTEVGAYETRYTVHGVAMYWYFDYDDEAVVTGSLEVQGRNAGDEDNNPEPQFFEFGVTGISAYQSRLVILAGAYVSLSRTTDPTQFMRTTVTELLDDDAIEVSATSLSNAQFEYAIPYNKDLLLIAQNQQAVIPNNSVVLTPKTAAIYPTTNTEISLACQPTVVARSLYYAYQRTDEFYQVGEFLPSSYTDSQYTTQSTTDHIPLYASGIATAMSGSTANGIACISSDRHEVLVNQFYWAGDERPLMAYHKWELPYKVMYNTQVGDAVVLLLDNPDGGVFLVSTNTQLNQLGSKPVPFIDMYQYVDINSDGEGTKPDWLPDDVVAVAYDDINYRHMEVAIEIDGDTIRSEYIGELALGVRYNSEFSITPPFLKDSGGNAISSHRSTLHSLQFTFKATGELKYTVLDTYGYVMDTESSAATWSEVALGYTWVNSIGTVTVPCRTKLNSTEVTVATTSTTDLNVVSTEFNVRIPDRDVRRRK